MDIVPSDQKLGIISEKKKCVSKLKSSKNGFLTWTIDFESQVLAFFDTSVLLFYYLNMSKYGVFKVVKTRTILIFKSYTI